MHCCHHHTCHFHKLALAFLWLKYAVHQQNLLGLPPQPTSSPAAAPTLQAQLKRSRCLRSIATSTHNTTKHPNAGLHCLTDRYIRHVNKQCYGSCCTSGQISSRRLSSRASIRQYGHFNTALKSGSICSASHLETVTAQHLGTKQQPAAAGCSRLA